MNEAKIILILIFAFLTISSSEAFVSSQIASQKSNQMMGIVEQTIITNVSFNSINSATVSIKNTGALTVVISVAYINQNKAIIDTCEAPFGLPRDKSSNFIVTLQNGTEFS